MKVAVGCCSPGSNVMMEVGAGSEQTEDSHAMSSERFYFG